MDCAESPTAESPADPASAESLLFAEAPAAPKLLQTLPLPSVTSALLLLPLLSGSFMEDGLAHKLLYDLARIEVNIARVTSVPASGTFTSLSQTISYADHYVETFGFLALFSVDGQVLMGDTTIAEVEDAVRKLQKFLESTDFVCLFSDLNAAADEKEAFVILAGRLLTPLAGECVLSVEYQHLCRHSRTLRTGHLGWVPL